MGWFQRWLSKLWTLELETPFYRFEQQPFNFTWWVVMKNTLEFKERNLSYGKK